MVLCATEGLDLVCTAAGMSGTELWLGGSCDGGSLGRLGAVGGADGVLGRLDLRRGRVGGGGRGFS